MMQFQSAPTLCRQTLSHAPTQQALVCVSPYACVSSGSHPARLTAEATDRRPSAYAWSLRQQHSSVVVCACVPPRSPGEEFTASHSSLDDRRPTPLPPAITSDGSSSSNASSADQPSTSTSTSQSPPAPAPTSAPSDGSNSDSANHSGSGGGAGPKPNLASASSEKEDSLATDDDADVDVMLGEMWTNVKKTMKGQGLSESEVEVLESVTVDELMNSNVLMQRMAAQQLGPILQALGIQDDPLEFFTDLIKLGTFVQFVTCGVLFYSSELWAGFDTGEAFRAVVGLSLGYLTRPFFRVEQLTQPIIQPLLQFAFPNAVYDAVKMSASEVTGALNTFGVALAAALIVPRLLWGWNTDESLQFVAPWVLGILMFDPCYLVAVMFRVQQKLRR